MGVESLDNAIPETPMADVQGYNSLDGTDQEKLQASDGSRWARKANALAREEILSV